MRSEYYLEGLSCASCAEKISQKILEQPDIQSASLSFATKKLIINSDQLVQTTKIEQIANAIEPGIKLVSAHDHGHDHGQSSPYDLWRILGALVLYGLSFALTDYATPLLIAAYFLVGYDVLWRAITNIRRGQVFDENFLMAIATLGAFAIGEFPEGVTVMLFYQIGEYFQDRAVDHSRKSIASMMNLRVETVRLKKGETTREISPEDVRIGDRILILPGEKVALDGKVLSGQSHMATANITGESLPRFVKSGDELLGGFVNGEGTIEMEVTKVYAESTVAKILELVENAANKKAQTEQFITKFARVYTPIVVGIAAAMAVFMPLILGQPFQTWFYRALVFLVISCPCALVLSVPLSYFAGLGAVSKHGLVIKGGNYLEALEQAKTLVVDKTGTITEGVFSVTQINPVKGVSGSELLEAAAMVEASSNHPIASSIKEAYGKDLPIIPVVDYAGEGVVSESGIAAGNDKLMRRLGIEHKENTAIGTVIYVAKEGEYLGNILISDKLKENVAPIMKALHKEGMERVIMLTGDHKNVAEAVAIQAGIDEYRAELLPQDKVSITEQLKTQYPEGKLVFVGDGTNDAPVLAQADLGVSMGDIGSDAALEASDMVLMRGRLEDLLAGFSIAKFTKKIVWQNIVFSIGIKLVILALGAVGLASMWAAVFADVGVALIAVLNALRILRVEPPLV